MKLSFFRRRRSASPVVEPPAPEVLVAKIPRARLDVGQVVRHRLFGYRGVIFDVDPMFQGSDEWYERVARTRPPRDRPWYHVLVDGAEHTTYVAERNLEGDSSGGEVAHPQLDRHFERFENGAYIVQGLQ